MASCIAIDEKTGIVRLSFTRNGSVRSTRDSACSAQDHFGWWRLEALLGFVVRSMKWRGVVG